MLDFIRKHTRLVMLLLAVILVPSFVFMGVSQWGDLDFSGGDYLAKVKSRKITAQQFDTVWRQTLEEMRQQHGPDADIARQDTPDNRAKALDQLVNNVVLLQSAEDQGLNVSDRGIVNIYKGALGPNNTVDRKVLDIYRPNVVLRNFILPIATSYEPPATVKNAVYARLAEQRKVQFKVFKGMDYLNDISTPDETELKAWYEKNKQTFEIDASADVDYLVLNQETASKDIETPDDAALRQFYKQNIKNFIQPEERTVSHIQINIPDNASESDLQALQDKVKKVAAEAKAHPEQFAELAKKYSDDSGTKMLGGDLDTWARGQNEVAGLDSAVFDEQGPGIREPVKLDKAYHIFNVTHVTPGHSKSFEEVKPQLITDAKLKLASDNFSKLSAKLQDLLNQNSSGLENVASSMNLPLHHMNSVTAKGIPKTQKPDEDALRIFADKQVLDTLFSSQPLPVGSNSNIIDVSAGELVVMHVKARHKPRIPELSEVKDEVEAFYKQTQAQDLARKDGEKLLQSLNSDGHKGSMPDGFEEPVQLSKAASHDTPPKVLDAVMNLPEEKIPAAVGLDIPGTYNYVVAYVEDTTPAKPEDIQAMANTPAAFILKGGFFELKENVTKQIAAGYKIKLNKPAINEVLNRK